MRQWSAVPWSRVHGVLGIWILTQSELAYTAHLNLFAASSHEHACSTVHVSELLHAETVIGSEQLQRGALRNLTMFKGGLLNACLNEH